MNLWTLMGPHAAVDLLLSNDEAAARVSERLALLPGVRRKGASWLVPMNALAVFGQQAGALGASIRRADWILPPEPARTWAEVDTFLREQGVLQEWVLDGFMTQYQKDAVAFGWNKSGVHYWHSTGCLTGDTEIAINRGGKGFKVRLQDLVARTQGTWKGKGKRWNPSIPTRVQSYREGCILLNDLVDAFCTGEKEVFILTAGTLSIKATADHRFLTAEDGWKTLAELRPGDRILARGAHGDAAPEKKPKIRYKLVYTRYHPYASVVNHKLSDHICRTHRYKPGHATKIYRVPEHRLVAEAELNGISLEELIRRCQASEADVSGLKFLDPKEWAVHHKNRDPYDNRPENLEVLSHEEHGRRHADEGTWKNVALGVVEAEIDSIEPAGRELTYDLTMLSPHNNYVANGFVVHNSGKTLTGIATSLSVEGPVVVVTRAVSRIQYAREIERFCRTKAFIVRPAAQAGPAKVRGETYNMFRARRKGQGLSPSLMAAAWEAYKMEHGVDAPPSISAYLAECAQKRLRPFIVVGWEALSDNLADLRAAVPACVIFDEAHRGKSTKRFAVQHLPELPSDPMEAAKESRRQEAELKAKGGFLKDTEDGRKGFLPLDNLATCAAELARAARKRICTTATPIKDRTRDLWAQLDLAEPNCWGSSTQWRKRYCLVPETPILMGDGRYLPIGEIKEGDEVIGWDSSTGKRLLRRTKVIATSRRMAEVVQLRLESGAVIRCTRDHHWLYSLTPGLKKPYRPTSRWVDREGGRWVRGVDHLLRVGFTPSDPRGLDTDAYKMGYIRGLLEGDGHVRILKSTYEPHTEWGQEARKARGKKGPPKGYQASVFSIELPHLERALRFSDELGMESTGIKPRKDPDGWTLGWYNKKDYRRIMTAGRDSRGDSFRRGWLAGIYDAEGSGAQVAQYERVNPTTYDQIARWLEHFGFQVTRADEYVQILGGKWELLRFYDLVRPALTRKLDTLSMFGGKPHFRFDLDTSSKDRIRSMAPLMTKAWGADLRGTTERATRLAEVVSIQTETGNYIAAGYASKNCDMKPGVYGGMDDRGDSNTDELNARKEWNVHRLSYHDTHRNLPPKRRQSMYVAPEDQVSENGSFVRELKQAQARGASAVLEVKLAIAASRKRKAVLSGIEDHLASGQKVVVFTARRKDCEEMGELVKSATKKLKVVPEVWASHGGHPTDVRQGIVDSYMAHPGPCILVGTGDAFGEALNLDTTDAAFFVMLPYTPGQLRQWEGRFHRASTKKPVIIYYAIAEGTVDEHVASIIIDKLPAVEKISQDHELAAAKSALAGYQDQTDDEFASSVLSLLD